MPDYAYMRQKIVAAASDARKTIDTAEQAVLLVDPKQLLSEQSRAVFAADEALCVASDKFETFYRVGDDWVTLGEQDNA